MEVSHRVFAVEPGHRKSRSRRDPSHTQSVLSPSVLIRREARRGWLSQPTKGAVGHTSPAGTDQAGHGLSQRPHTVWGFKKWPVPAHGLHHKTRQKREEQGPTKRHVLRRPLCRSDVSDDDEALLSGRSPCGRYRERPRVPPFNLVRSILLSTALDYVT